MQDASRLGGLVRVLDSGEDRTERLALLGQAHGGIRYGVTLVCQPVPEPLSAFDSFLLFIFGPCEGFPA
jgi:hypothetical protein